MSEQGKVTKDNVLTGRLQPYQSMASEDVLLALQEDGADGNLMGLMIEGVLAQLAAARASYFRRPVASMCFGASASDSEMLAKFHPELRELVFEPGEALPDAVFWGCRHLAVRRCLLQLLEADSAIIDTPYAHQILLDGVEPHEHSFVFSTRVPLADVVRDQSDPGAKHFVVADLCRSRLSYHELIKFSRDASASELLVVAPYDPGMWQYTGGHQLAGSYVYEWVDSNKLPGIHLAKPMKLPSRFFSSRRFASYTLLVHPYGSARGYSYTRDDFIGMFSGVGVPGRYVETRVTRNGFAEVSIIGFADAGRSTDLAVILDRESRRSVPLGHVEIPSITGDMVMETLGIGRKFDLQKVRPTYVPSSYYNRAMKYFYKIKTGRDTIRQMVMHLQAYSARMYYNGAIVTAEAMVDVEEMCAVAERIIRSNSRARVQIAELSERARVPVQSDPMAYAVGVLKWAAAKVVDTPDVAVGMRKVVDFISSGRVSDDTHGEEEPALRFEPPDVSFMTQEKQEVTDVIVQQAEALFGSPAGLPYQILREEISVDRSDLFQVRLQLKMFKSSPVDVHVVQEIYDQLFPGNSVIDPTVVQLQAESGDVKFIVDVQDFRVSVPAFFSTLEGYEVVPSKLRTSVGADLLGSFRSLMSSLMKRNFNRPRPEASGDRRRFVQQAVSVALRRYARKDCGALLARYALDVLSVNRAAIEMWGEKRPIADVLAAATMMQQDAMVDPARYNLMPKDVPKPTLSLEAQGHVAVGQTIVFHTKDVISLTSGVFTLLISRLIALFNRNVVLAFGADEHSSGMWADKYLDDARYYVYEIDIPKFDKSQDWACFELVLHVMELMGADPWLVGYWRRATETATVFNASFHLVFQTMFGNRSGNAATLATNCIVLLFAFLNSFDDLGIVAVLIKGDDSVLVTRRPMKDQHEAYLYQHWGFSMKRVGRRGAVQFCSSVFVKDGNGKYCLVRDVVRVIEKFGRALSVNRPASYFLDYYASVVDTAVSYNDETVVQNLTAATELIYGKSVDVQTLVRFVKYVSSDSVIFLKHLYGFSDKQIMGMRDIDSALEALTRVRTSRFAKGKDLVDDHHELRLTLVDKMMMSQDWVFCI